MAAAVRRVVTGKDAAGKAVVLMDGESPRVHTRAELGVTNTILWITDSVPASVLGNSDAADRTIGVTPPHNGTILKIIEFAPHKDVHADYETKLQIFRKMGLAPEGPSAQQPRDAGMHRTHTLDYAVILSGEIHMLLDDSEVHLKAGDVVVQRGTNHAWVNRGSEPCRAVFVLIDAAD